jgi:hypothetical protein
MMMVVMVIVMVTMVMLMVMTMMMVMVIVMVMVMMMVTSFAVPRRVSSSMLQRAYRRYHDAIQTSETFKAKK